MTLSTLTLLNVVAECYKRNEMTGESKKLLKLRFLENLILEPIVKVIPGNFHWIKQNAENNRLKLNAKQGG